MINNLKFVLALIATIFITIWYFLKYNTQFGHYVIGFAMVSFLILILLMLHTKNPKYKFIFNLLAALILIVFALSFFIIMIIFYTNKFYDKTLQILQIVILQLLVAVFMLYKSYKSRKLIMKNKRK